MSIIVKRAVPSRDFRSWRTSRPQMMVTGYNSMIHNFIVVFFRPPGQGVFDTLAMDARTIRLLRYSMITMLATLNTRLWFFLGFLGCCSLLGFGAFLQFVEELEPCPLCISQRLAIMATGLLFLTAAIHNRGVKIYALIGAVLALVGAGISARHVWLQHLPPDQVPECSPGLEYVFQNFPLADTVKLMLTGTGECSQIEGIFLGLTIPGWTLIAFLLLAAFSLGAIWLNSASKTQP